jgi:hypothetical protein
MYKKLLLLVALMAISLAPSAPDAEVHEQTTTLLALGEAPILGIGKPKYNQNRIQRQNTVGRTNARNKRLLRKNGIGLSSPPSGGREVDYPNGYFWMLPKIDWEKGGGNG